MRKRYFELVRERLDIYFNRIRPGNHIYSLCDQPFVMSLLTEDYAGTTWVLWRSWEQCYKYYANRRRSAWLQAVHNRLTRRGRGVEVYG